MKKKLRIGILFGGRSGEHEVSLLSAASILKAIDKAKYDVVPLGITREGRWVTAHDAHALLSGKPAPENPRLAGNPEATPTATPSSNAVKPSHRPRQSRPSRCSPSSSTPPPNLHARPSLST